MDNNKWYVIYDANPDYDECFVVDSEFDTLCSEYVIVGEFTSEAEAEDYANKLNNHEIQLDISCAISDFDYSIATANACIWNKLVR